MDKKIETLSGKIDHSNPRLAVILAAGHGKRIKSEKSKMLHEIWGKTTIERVADAVAKGLDTPNVVVVLGIKADEVLDAIQHKHQYIYVHQKEQLGTGHAVKIAFENKEIKKYNGDVYIFPGDIGLLTAELVEDFKDYFNESHDEMSVLTAQYKGDPEQNYYGRIVRLKKEKRGMADIPPEFENKVMAIREYKDIIHQNESEPANFLFHDKTVPFSRDELLNTTEFNTGIYAFRSDELRKYIQMIKSDNVQSEIYLTDLIEIYNNQRKIVGAYRISDQTQVLGFNVKSVLKQMQAIYREKVYSQLKDLVTIEDHEHFFIADEVVEEMINMDKKSSPLDISIGINSYIGPRVKLNRKVKIGANVILKGNIQIGENVHIGENCSFDNYPGQEIHISENCRFIGNARIKGQVYIKEDSRIESGVRVTGSGHYPVEIGKSVTIKGNTYIFGSVIEDEILIEHSVIKTKHVERITRKDGTIQPVRYILPLPEGIDSLRRL